MGNFRGFVPKDSFAGAIRCSILALVLSQSICLGQSFIEDPIIYGGEAIANETSLVNVTSNDLESIWPDFTECSPIYGTDISYEGCQKALKKIYPGLVPKLVAVEKSKVPLWFADDDDGKPTCNITIDLAGFSDETKKRWWSNTIRDLVKKPLEKCVKTGGSGGFVTYGLADSGKGMSKVKLYPADRPTFVYSPLFLTITISLPSPSFPNLRPGDTDPKVPTYLNRVILNSWKFDMNLPSTKDKQVVLMNQLDANVEGMMPGGKKTWWDSTHFEAFSPSGVDFVCEGGSAVKGEGQGVGGLRARDCEEASFGFLGRGDVDVKPGDGVQYKFGNCAFKVESTASTIKVAWGMLRAGADLLLNKCLMSDGAPGTGGRTQYTGVGPSQGGNPWPEGLVISMVKVGLVGTGNETATGNLTTVSAGNATVVDGRNSSGYVGPVSGLGEVATS